jgi:hypothetical protein
VEGIRGKPAHEPRDWAPHYKVSHVSGPHALWIDEEKKLFVYYHGENDVTRFASTTDGIHFQYEGVPATTKDFDAISEASYARVFRYTIPGKGNGKGVQLAVVAEKNPVAAVPFLQRRHD